MTNRIDAQKLVAFDVHVHLEQPGGDTEADRKAAAYFKGGAPRDRRRDGRVLPLPQHGLHRLYGR